MDQTLQEQVSQLVTMLKNGVSEERRRAAVELGRISVRTRGAIRTPGSLAQPSEPLQFPGDYKSYLDAARAAFQDGSILVCARKSFRRSARVWGLSP